MTLEVKEVFENPFKPSAGHMPPYLAGRETEQNEFRQLLTQKVILKNLILTGLRGVGKTVLLESLKPMANKGNWLWVGTDLSESASLKEETMATRLLTDIAVQTSHVVVEKEEFGKIGFAQQNITTKTTLTFALLKKLYAETPGLVSDKLKFILELVWKVVPKNSCRGIIFAYDEAQNLSDHADKNEFPTSLLLEVFQSIQRKNIPIMLILTGLPTLQTKLVSARTYSERMFTTIELTKLNREDSRDAILIPIQKEDCPISIGDDSVDLVIKMSGGYPYFIQYICREVYDVWIQKIGVGEEPSVPIQEIIQKLDLDFFLARWSRATDRQRELMMVIANLDSCGEEFTALEAADASKMQLAKPFSSSHISQMLSSLSDAGLIYKSRYGKYSFAVPLLHEFIKRQQEQELE